MNRGSAMFPFTAGTNLGSAAQAARVNPNPAARPAAPQGSLATTQGIQAALPKLGFETYCNPLLRARRTLKTLNKSADTQVSGSNPAVAGAVHGRNNAPQRAQIGWGRRFGPSRRGLAPGVSADELGLGGRLRGKAGLVHEVGKLFDRLTRYGRLSSRPLFRRRLVRLETAQGTRRTTGRIAAH